MAYRMSRTSTASASLESSSLGSSFFKPCSSSSESSPPFTSGSSSSAFGLFLAKDVFRGLRWAWWLGSWAKCQNNNDMLGYYVSFLVKPRQVAYTQKKENSPAGDILHPCTVWENQEANAIQRIICQNIGNVIVDEILVVRPKDSNCRAIHPQTD